MFFLYPDMNVKERETVLSNQCAKKEMRNYSRTLSDAEINQDRAMLANDMVSKKKLEETLANLMKEYKEKIKNIDVRVDERLERITNRKKTISGTLYGIANQQQGRMMFYDNHGELIDSRELLPEEKQGQLFLTNTNDALKDLPFETAQVVKDITAEHEERTQAQPGLDTQPAGGGTGDVIEEAHVIPEGSVEQQPAPQPWAPTDQTTLANFSHDEDGWQNMTDAQLVAKYGSVDISLIRTMKLSKGKWQAPKESKGVAGRLKGKDSEADDAVAGDPEQN